MKVLFVLLLSFLLVHDSDAQIFKKIGQKLKDDADWRIRHKADEQINKGFDSLLTIPKKIKDKKKLKNNNTQEPAPQNQNNNNTAPKNNDQKPSGNLKTESDPDDGTPKDGYISLSLSDDKAYTGFGIRLGIRITGESVNYKNYNQVQVVITGPSTNEIKQVPLSSDGKFIMDWSPTDETGDFTVTATSSDKKAKKKLTFSVEALDAPDYDEWPEKNIKETKKAEEKLKEAVEEVEGGISPKDKEELETKMDEVKEKLKDVYKLFKDLNKANKEVFQLIKKEKKVPPNFSANLSELNNIFTDQANQMRQVNEKIATHKPQDNTICEKLVMANEALAAFTTITGFWAKSITTVVSKIISGVANTAKPIDAANTVDKFFFPKQLKNIYSNSQLDAESLSSKLGKAGFVANMVQYSSDVLLKKYCGIFKGEIKHDYVIESRNKHGVTWLKYGVIMEGALSLRYPKEGSKGKIIKMKGNIEGNATKFTFYQHVYAEDGFYEGSQGKIEVIELRVIKPPAFPFVSSLNDPAGFGAVARGIATPASFYIPIDAEFDVDANKIKIFLNTPLNDFSDLITNQLIFLLVGGDLLPYIKWMSFPIAKAGTTLGSIIRSNNEFDVTKDAKGNLSFFSKANKHIGDKNSEREYDLNFTISAQKQ